MSIEITRLWLPRGNNMFATNVTGAFLISILIFVQTVLSIFVHLFGKIRDAAACVRERSRGLSSLSDNRLFIEPRVCYQGKIRKESSLRNACVLRTTRRGSFFFHCSCSFTASVAKRDKHFVSYTCYARVFRASRGIARGEFSTGWQLTPRNYTTRNEITR